MKPILFNTEMIRAIMDGRKTVTRRVVKMPASATAKTADRVSLDNGVAHFSWSWAEEFTGFDVKMPYHPGDILYVRETWYKDSGRYMYRANYSDKEKFYRNGKEVIIKWCPSIHMPKVAARLFLRVTGVRVERLQDITEEGATAEGADRAYPYTDPVTGETSYMQDDNATHRGGFSCVWDSTIKPADRDLYGWAANPWVWVIELERISKEVVLKGGET